MEHRHLLESQAPKRRHHHHRRQVVATEFIWPVNLKEWFRGLLSGLFFYLMKLGLFSFLLVTTLFYAGGALCFAGLFWLARSQLSPTMNDFSDAFFYSAERMVGLDGRFDPIGAGASTLALVEAFIAMISGAALTGILYARFSQPKSSIVFSKCAVVTQHIDGKDALMFRIANGRRGQIRNCEVQVYAVCHKHANFVRLIPLKLEKEVMPNLELYPWTVFHTIDEESPFWEHSTWQDVTEVVERVIVHIRGTDLVVNGDIYAEKTYDVLDDVRVNEKLADVISREETPSGDLKRVVNYKRFHHTVASPSSKFEEMTALGGLASMNMAIESAEDERY